MPFNFRQYQAQFGREFLTWLSRRTAKKALAAALVGGGIWSIHRLSGKDDDYNTLEGLRHDGIAGTLRKELTDFGSGFDKVRQLAKWFGRTYEKTIASKTFQEALLSAEPIQELGTGLYARTHLMKGTIQKRKFLFFRDKEEFLFVRKELKETAREDVVQELRKVFGSQLTTHDAKHYMRGLNLKLEASMMKGLQETKSVPTVYRATEKSLFMEYVEGRPIREYLRQGGQMAPEAQVALREAAEEASRRGVINPDIHAGNILYNPETKRAYWVDWGLAHRSKIGPSASFQQMSEDLRKTTSSRSDIGTIAGKKQVINPLASTMPGTTAKMKAAQLSTELKAAQSQVWEAATRAGKRHTGRTGGHVKQLSRYGGKTE